MDGIIEQMKQLVNEFDFANFIPEVDSILGWVETLVRFFVMAAPICILVFGLFFLFLPPKEANHRAGYRTYFGMGSVEAWLFTQKLAGSLWSVLGAGLLAIALLLTNRFPDMEPMAMVYKAITCILWQIGLSAVLCLLINLVVTCRYDRNGDLRSEKRKK